MAGATRGVWASARERLTSAWFTFDRRSLGLARIAFAVLLLADLVRRVPNVDVWYGGDGLLPGWFMLQRSQGEPVFSAMFWAQDANEVLACFGVFAVFYLCLLVGYRTRLFHFLSLVAVVSLHVRASPVQNGGDRMMVIQVFWTLFLPLGDRFSVDALRRSLRERRERSIEDVQDRNALEPDASPVRSIAVFAVLAQLVVAYLMNAAQKTAGSWRDGSAIYDVMYLQHSSTEIACAVRDHIPRWGYVGLVRATLFIEVAAPLLILSPFMVAHARRVAIVMLTGLHLGITLLITVGLFSFSMMAYFPLLLGDEDWAMVGRFMASERRATLRIDPASPIGFTLARVIARLDRFRRVTVEAEAGAPPPNLEEVAAALPLGRVYAWLVGMMRLDILFEYEDAITRWLGLYAAGDPLPFAAATPRGLARVGFVAGEITCGVFMLAATNQVLSDNEIVPEALKFETPALVHGLIGYPQLYQGWNMFAPGVPLQSSLVFVDAETVDGRHVDPYNELATPSFDTARGIPWKELPRCTAQDSFFDHYTRELPNRKRWWPVFREWVRDYPKRTHQRSDRIVKVTLWGVTDPIPNLFTGQKKGELKWFKLEHWPRTKDEPPDTDERDRTPDVAKPRPSTKP